MVQRVRTWPATAVAACAALGLALALVTAPPASGDSAAGYPQLQSRYVAMRDGVRLAVDVWLPAGTTASARLPAVLQGDRYWRTPAYTGGIRNDRNYSDAKKWNGHGYAYVVADLRGTGASFGTLRAELGSAMIADIGTLADWIARQPWSDGRIGTTGVSYSGDVAALSLALRNHHITAAAPISYDFDPYEDILRPGGLLIEPLVTPYATLLRILDAAGGTTCATDSQTRQICDQAGLTGASPKPVDGPSGTALLAAARAEHAGNVNLIDFAEGGTYRDAAAGRQTWTVGSVGQHAAAIATAGVPILTQTGWLDAGTANGVLSQFTGLSNAQEDWIGPWSHGEGYLADPFQPSRQLTEAERQQLADALYAFFDRYVKDGQRPDGQRLLHYYTLNEDMWRTTTGWPVPGTDMRRLYLAGGGRLTPARPESGAPADVLTLDPTAGTGPLNRWHTNLDAGPVSYPDRAAVDRQLLTYTSAPLPAPSRITGLGRITLDVTGLHGTANGALYAYLEDVAPDGHVTYVTEGELALADRAQAPAPDNPAWRQLRTPRTFAGTAAAPFPQGRPQQVTFDLLPTSVLVRPGDRIRIAIAAADPDAFQLLPTDGDPTYQIGRTSYVDLPIAN